MAEVVNIVLYALKRRQQQEAEDHARALVLFEYAAALARANHPGLIALVHEVLGGADEFEARVRQTMMPLRKTDAPKLARTRRTPK